MVTSKNELSGIIAEKTGSTKKQSTQFIDAFLETVGEQLAKGESVRLIGFGTFLAKHKRRRARADNRQQEKRLQYLQRQFLFLNLEKC